MTEETMTPETNPNEETSNSETSETIELSASESSQTEQESTTKPAEQEVVTTNEAETIDPVPTESTSSEVVVQDTKNPSETEQLSDNETIIAQDNSHPSAPTDEAKAAKEAEAREAREKEKKEKQAQLDRLYSILLNAKENNETIDVQVVARIKGGLRVMLEDLQLFLPASHFNMKRTPNEDELTSVVGSIIKVHIHEIQDFDEGRKAVIVSRKQVAMNEFWSSIKVGDKVVGKITSVASFGVFVDIGGVEGLVHVSRLKQIHVKDPNDYYNKGEEIEVVILDIDKEKGKITLSRKELEESPWRGASERFVVGNKYKGFVRRLADFGAYIELEPGIDGLVRNNELSWTRRIKKPSDILENGQEVEVEVISISEEKQVVALSIKRATDNPWLELQEKYPNESVHNATVLQVLPAGCVVNVNGELDGFMPRSKMRDFLRAKKIPVKPGDEIEVIISDLNPKEESVILAPKLTEEEIASTQREQKPRPPRKTQSHSKMQTPGTVTQKASDFSIFDMLSDEQKQGLINSVDGEVPEGN